jgi:hypothetical protein
LKVVVGDGSYLLASAQVLEVRPAEAAGNALPMVDCRRLFEVRAATPGWQVVLAPGDGTTGALIVDRFDGLVVLGDEELHPLPPIGRLGTLFDAVSLPQAGERPALRLRIDPALFAAAS